MNEIKSQCYILQYLIKVSTQSLRKSALGFASKSIEELRSFLEIKYRSGGTSYLISHLVQTVYRVLFNSKIRIWVHINCSVSDHVF